MKNSAKKKITKKKSPKTLAKEKAWRYFSKYIRLRDCDAHTEIGKCFTCNKPHHYKQMQAGHFIHNTSATYFDEMNVNAQCVRCNYYLGGAGAKYRKHLIKKYGKTGVEALEERAKPGTVFKISDYNEIAEIYKTKVKQEVEKEFYE